MNIQLYGRAVDSLTWPSPIFCIAFILCTLYEKSLGGTGLLSLFNPISSHIEMGVENVLTFETRKCNRKVVLCNNQTNHDNQIQILSYI